MIEAGSAGLWSLQTPIYSTVAHQGVGIPRRVIQFGESEMPLMPLGTLLVHDKALLGVFPKGDTACMEIRSVTDIASRHRGLSIGST